MGRYLVHHAISRSTYSSGYHRRRRGGEMGTLVIGGALMIVGSIGVFFASLIKSAVSRQREYLADASAVQFTRYPQGLVGALKKIGGFTAKTAAMQHPSAGEVSHMFFSQGLYAGMDSVFSTHPPLVERIQRIDPSFTVENDETQPELSSSTFVSQESVSYTHLRAHETDSYLVCRLLLEKKKQ